MDTFKSILLYTKLAMEKKKKKSHYYELGKREEECFCELVLPVFLAFSSLNLQYSKVLESVFFILIN